MDAQRRRAVWKFAGLAAFALAAVALVRFTPAGAWLGGDGLSSLMEQAGAWAPVLFVLVYAAGVCLFVPGALLTVLGAALFGPWMGFLVVWAGAMLGAAMAFLIGRTLGRDFAAQVIGDRLRRYDQSIARNGFAVTLYLRLAYFPFTPMNFGMGLTAVRFRDYLLGTGLGILVGTFVFTFFVGAVREVWASGRWEDLLGWRVLASVGLFVGSLFIPSLLKRIRGDET